MTLFITLGDIVGLAIGGIACIAAAIFFALDAWKEHRCKHEEFFETSACDAICKKCSKNLGFIGTLREKRVSHERL